MIWLAVLVVLMIIPFWVMRFTFWSLLLLPIALIAIAGVYKATLVTQWLVVIGGIGIGIWLIRRQANNDMAAIAAKARADAEARERARVGSEHR